ncbi:hypothetical protein K493DRAFT_333378 [Basidiobolus meristosporus CBS 931.73]|uniref:Kinase-like protein n=1 Tax=Basidiobolus meristosporus CBS 931.73 TaxID=1314790 RepID=A0A1Y1Z6F3_9FUNG|nr:hypothetical protein K493DRAFT_333378 [Basidiobolus meristosporus CBS 931.73]|eukprot:ORY05882.1 hypothetical protein K493DRAFT_333378 [Basidiobolus meristosporus CBS 931.73]
MKRPIRYQLDASVPPVRRNVLSITFPDQRRTPVSLAMEAAHSSNGAPATQASDILEDPLGKYLESLDFLLTLDSPESLEPLLKKITKIFLADERYLNDPRYLNVWLLRSRNSVNPLNVFKKMEALRVGSRQAAFYDEYARFWLGEGRIDMARKIYQQGIVHQAEPVNHLRKMYKGLSCMEGGSAKKTKGNLMVAIRQIYNAEESCFEEMRALLPKHRLRSNRPSPVPQEIPLQVMYGSESGTRCQLNGGSLSQNDIAVASDSADRKPEDTCRYFAKQPCLFSHQEVCDPHSPMLITQYLEKNLLTLSQYAGFHNLSKHVKGRSKPLGNSSKQSRTNASNSIKRSLLFLGNSSFIIQRKLGEGGFGKVYQVQHLDLTPELKSWKREGCLYFALKVQTPAGAWEFYILNQLTHRLSTELSKMIIKPYALYYYQDVSYLLMECSTQGTLLDAVNFYKVQGKFMDELTVMFFTVELLKIIEGLHNIQVLHADLKADNLLLRLENADRWDEQYSPTGEHGWGKKGLKLIDFGKAVDLTLFPEGCRFRSRNKGGAYDCPQVREKRCWTYHIDYYGLANIIHTMLHGKYLRVTQTSTIKGAQRACQPVLPFKRYWDIELWEQVFDTLLNPEAHGTLPITEKLHALRSSLETRLWNGCTPKADLMRFHGSMAIDFPQTMSRLCDLVLCVYYITNKWQEPSSVDWATCVLTCGSKGLGMHITSIFQTSIFTLPKLNKLNMPNPMDIEQLVKQLELDYNVNISAKATKFQTRAMEKLGNRMTSSSTFYYMLAFIELACQSLDEDFERLAALESHDLDEKTYLKKLSETRYVLHQDSEELISALTEEFKCDRIYHEVHALLDDMKACYDEPEAVTSPVFVGAGFYLTAIQFGYRIDKQKVMDEVCATNFEFKQVTEYFQDFAGETLNFFSQMKLQNTKRRAKSDNSFDEAAFDDVENGSKPEHTTHKKRRTKKADNPVPNNLESQENKPTSCLNLPTKAPSKPLKQLRLVAVKLATLKSPITTTATEKTVFEPLNAVTSMANDTYFRETQDYREYLVWKRNLIAKLRRTM